MATENTLHGTERAPAEWDTVFANHVSDEGLISRVSGELLKARHETDVIYKWAKYLNEHFSGGVCMGSGHLQGQATVPPPLTPAAWPLSRGARPRACTGEDASTVSPPEILLCPLLPTGANPGSQPSLPMDHDALLPLGGSCSSRGGTSGHGPPCHYL